MDGGSLTGGRSYAWTLWAALGCSRGRDRLAKPAPRRDRGTVKIRKQQLKRKGGCSENTDGPPFLEISYAIANEWIVHYYRIGWRVAGPKTILRDFNGVRPSRRRNRRIRVCRALPYIFTLGLLRRGNLRSIATASLRHSFRPRTGPKRAMENHSKRVDFNRG